jgi:hypothetical protein
MALERERRTRQQKDEWLVAALAKERRDRENTDAAHLSVMAGEARVTSRCLASIDSLERKIVLIEAKVDALAARIAQFERSR